ncbi:MAG: type II toxin-antitoxin system Phd/YefM family antitoxin [Trueperaceae bacterium]|nr:MAG: type II toxin-antitoxin system Phd/YefM family antitoxin [Trueperaceae bacterium]
MATTITSREFNQNVSAAKRAAEAEPVFITDRGRPAHVLLSIEQYRRLAGTYGNIVQMLAMEEDVAFEPARLEPRVLQTPDLG